MIPVLNREPLYQFKIPELSGGLNLRDGISLVNDNQLTDVKNMWYKDGILRTRPKITEIGGVIPHFVGHANQSYNANKTLIDGKEYYLEVIVGGENGLVARFLGKDNDIDLPQKNFDFIVESVLPIIHNGNVYLYVHGKDTSGNARNEIYVSKRGIEGDYGSFTPPADGEIYTPLVLTNCWSSYNSGGDMQSLMRKGATQVEGFNLLGNRYEIQGSMYDASENGSIEVRDQDGNVQNRLSYMEYSVPFTPNNLGYRDTISLKYTDKNGKEYIHSVYCPNINAEKSQAEGEDVGDGLFLHSFIKGDIVHISLNTSPRKGDDDPDWIYQVDYINNNMTINAPCENPAENWEKITAMTKAVWYGNTSLGINGGSRLFLGGNIKDSEQALVIWSDFENPLYFSENNYAYVGDKSQRVTAFGRQGASLIVFKENEIYSTQYTQSDVTAEELMNQTAIDLSTQMAYFPMVLIHPTIGCDCPNTIQLCRNRLVFANSSGRVFTLTAQNQYSERNVYEVSEMISDRLKTEKDLQKACSVDWDGKYILFVNKNAYLMDYNSYGYENIASYTRQSDANMLLPWWYWELPTETKNAVLLNESIILTDIKNYLVAGTERCASHKYYINGEYGNDELFFTDFDNGTQKLYEQIIPTMLQTKIFDFGEQAKYKTISSVDIAFGNNKNVPISVKFINGVNDTDEHVVYANGAETTLKVPEHINNKKMIPYTRICYRFGILLQCAGNMEIDGIAIQYKKAGGIR